MFIPISIFFYVFPGQSDFFFWLTFISYWLSVSRKEKTDLRIFIRLLFKPMVLLIIMTSALGVVLHFSYYLLSQTVAWLMFFLIHEKILLVKQKEEKIPTSVYFQLIVLNISVVFLATSIFNPNMVFFLNLKISFEQMLAVIFFFISFFSILINSRKKGANLSVNN
jgi:hypothetical protein